MSASGMKYIGINPSCEENSTFVLLEQANEK